MIRNLWQLITYHRHRCELWALRFSRSLSAIIRPPPIMLMIMALYILACLPVVLTYALLLALGVSETVAYLIMAIPAAALLFIVAPWFFRWFWIGLSMQFGSFKSADAKEKQLVAWTEAYEARAS
ncbi:hypothetical protein [Agrobacterium sp. LAD9]|uniref:hypothetical protein n=1 Tax=Agrobacterium sp. LAD9 TaxID=2055153 RepID=UPI001864D995|nr:hypothetical protein [Agrobacterium sp. LAD9]